MQDVLVKIVFRILFGLGTAVMLFGILYAQTPSTDHTSDLVIWSIASALLFLALIVAWVKRSPAPSIVWSLVIFLELLMCGYAINDIIHHLHSL
jgi:hypothetical protein